MAKKVKKKKVEKKEPAKSNFSNAEQLFLDNVEAIKAMAKLIDETNKRIDRIVDAHERCKSLKNL